MSSQRIPQKQVDGLDTLRQLLELAKNPQSFIETQEDVREQLQLTEAEELKMKQAREFLAAYDQKVSDLDNRKLAVEQSEERQRQSIATFNQEITEQHNALNARVAALDEKRTQIESLNKQHVANAQKLADDRREHDSNVSAFDDKCKKREDALKRREDAQLAEDVRLSNMRMVIENKAKKLAEALEG